MTHENIQTLTTGNFYSDYIGKIWNESGRNIKKLQDTCCKYTLGKSLVFSANSVFKHMINAKDWSLLA